MSLRHSQPLRPLIAELATIVAMGLAVGVGTYSVLCCFGIVPFAPLGLVLAIQAGWLFLTLAGLRTGLDVDGQRLSVRAAIGAGLVAAGVLAVLGILYDGALRLAFGTGTPTLGPWADVRALRLLPAALVIGMGVVIGPAAEERVYRGAVFGSLHRAGRPRLGAALSALLFATFRLDPVNFVAYFGMGLLLAWLYLRSGTLVATWTAQAAMNSAMFALLYSGYE
jgi:membrane protease YdiL (CAAX protease family)